MTLVIPSDALVSGSVKNVKHLQQKLEETYLVGGFNPFEKIFSSNWIIFASRGGNKQNI